MHLSIHNGPAEFQKRNLPCLLNILNLNILNLKGNSHSSYLGTWTNMTSLFTAKWKYYWNHPLSVDMLLYQKYNKKVAGGKKNQKQETWNATPLLAASLANPKKNNPKIHRCIFPLQSTAMPPRELPEMNLVKPTMVLDFMCFWRLTSDSGSTVGGIRTPPLILSKSLAELLAARCFFWPSFEKTSLLSKKTSRKCPAPLKFHVELHGLY